MLKKTALGFVFGTVFFVGSSIFAFFPSNFISGGGENYVDGYIKENGTYVEGYYRTAPNNTTVDNRGCYEHLTECYAGLDQSDFSKVLDLYQRLSEVGDESFTLREDLMRQYPGISTRQLEGLYVKRYNALVTERAGIIRDLERLRDLGKLQYMEKVVAEQERRVNAMKRMQDLFEQGGRAEKNGRLDDAIEYYEKAISEAKTFSPNAPEIGEMEAVVNTLKYQLEKKEEEKRIAKQKAQEEQEKQERMDKLAYDLAKTALGSKANVLDGIAATVKTKDYATQMQIKTLIKSFQTSNDSETRYIGTYLGYLLR